MKTFFLGTHNVNWLWEIPSVPFFISYRRLSLRKSLKPALSKWCLDSGGFSELSQYGEWTIPAKQYARDVIQYTNEIGSLQWSAVQDWMCEPHILKKTNASISVHQSRTVRSYLTLTDLAPEVSWAPVLQGWSIDDYLRHIERYIKSGVDVTTLPVVGVGSICRRQHTEEAVSIIKRLAKEGVKIHGFGLKTQGLAQVQKHITSADSLSWSFTARRTPVLMPMCWVQGTHKNCANCRSYALHWRKQLLKGLKKCQK